MLPSNSSELDLLRKRREDLDISPYEEISTTSLRKKGIIIGLSILFLSISSCFAIILLNIKQGKKIINLTQEAKEYNLLKEKFNKEVSITKEIYKVNDDIAKNVIGIRSGSALLVELKDIMPKSIQLKKINTKNNSLELEGLSPQPLGLDSISTLKLQLESSLFVNPSNIFIKRAWESQGSSFNEKKKIKMMNFKLIADFAEIPDPKIVIPYLQRLGSNGIARRIKILDQEGFTK